MSIGIVFPGVFDLYYTIFLLSFLILEYAENYAGEYILFRLDWKWSIGILFSKFDWAISVMESGLFACEADLGLTLYE